MKKSYIAPQTEAIKLLGENAIMVGSPTITKYTLQYEIGNGGGMR